MIALALLDTGARDSKELNLISRKLADKIVSKEGQTYVRPSTIGAMFDICKTYRNAIDLNIQFYSTSKFNSTKQRGRCR